MRERKGGAWTGLPLMKAQKDNFALTRGDSLINNFAPAPSLLLSFVLNNLTF